MRPFVRFLDDSLRERIITEGRRLLHSPGVEIHNPAVLALLGDHGAHIDPRTRRALYSEDLIDRALATVPRGFRVYDSAGRPVLDLSGDNVHYTPGSAAITFLDGRTQAIRRPTTADYIRYAKLVSRMQNLASQSTALVPADVHERISDSYRLYLSLLYCEKPVVTGTFTAEAFGVMRDLQIAVRGSGENLAAQPLTIFSCCPTAPLKWSDVTSQNLVDCATWNIPVEYISMPLSGFVAPATLVGSLIQHTAETLSGVVISQLVRPGTPALYGGSPAFFDVRYETTPMGSIATMMIDCAASEIGKSLGFPTQAYIGLSDAKRLDAQAGLESAAGATLAALAGINNISGPGMLDFESCFSLEKLIVDNEICGMNLHLLRGITPKEDFPAEPLMQELLRDNHLLIAGHTLKYLAGEDYVPGPVINRANRMRWEEEGSSSLCDRAVVEVDRAIAAYEPTCLPQEVRRALEERMLAEARRYGMEKLPDHG